jgi:hypothetical protein
MERLRELLAHGGIAILAVVVALALAGFQLADAIAQTAVFVLNQHASGEDFDFLDVTVFGTEIPLDAVVQSLLAALLAAGAWFAAWRLTRGATRTCPECRSQIAPEASVCRYCTTDLRAAEG